MNAKPSTTSPVALKVCPNPLPVAPRTNYLFFDYENVQESDLSRVQHDQVVLVVVVGEKQKSLPISFTEFLQHHPGQLRLVKTPRQGKNALDFVLAYEIGQVLMEEPSAYIHIISKDTGFDALIAHLKAQRYLAARHASISDVPILLSNSERLDQVRLHLKDSKRSRPRKRSTLENTIQQHFGKGLTSQVVDKTIKLLVHEKILTLSGTGKITYSAVG